jgi:hypothetical protein
MPDKGSFMKNTINHWLSKHPYGVTSIVFMIIVLFGWRMLGWGERQLGFLLLLYFIVALGIRLDDISRAIGSGGNPRPALGEAESLAAQLREIRLLLSRIHASLDKFPRQDDSEKP